MVSDWREKKPVPKGGRERKKEKRRKYGKFP